MALRLDENIQRGTIDATLHAPRSLMLVSEVPMNLRTGCLQSPTAVHPVFSNAKAEVFMHHSCTNN